jgi:hypothetical protein
MSTSNTRLFTITGRLLPKATGEQQALLSKRSERLVQEIRAQQLEQLWEASFSPRERAAIRSRGPRAESSEQSAIEGFEQTGT